MTGRRPPDPTSTPAGGSANERLDRGDAAEEQPASTAPGSAPPEHWGEVPWPDEEPGSSAQPEEKGRVVFENPGLVDFVVVGATRLAPAVVTKTTDVSYELDIRNKGPLVLRFDDLKNVKKFGELYAATFAEVPRVPEQDDWWFDVVAKIIERAEYTELTAEAADLGMKMAIIEDVLAGAGRVEDIMELRETFGVYEETSKDGRTTQYVHSPALLVRLRSPPERMHTNSKELCDMLHLMGFRKAKGYEKSDELRVWCRTVAGAGGADSATGDRDSPDTAAAADDTSDPGGES